MDTGYHVLKGSILYLENVSKLNDGIRNQIFVKLYIGVPESNCHTKQYPLAATTICINY
jgi:hypothetical protein